MKKSFVFALCCFALLSFRAQAQTEEVAIRTVIETMFDGMREADSSKVHSVFVDNVVMQTIVPGRDNVMMLRDGSLQNFLQAVGKPHPKVYDERISRYDIKIDGPMASVWTPYKFYLGEEFSHCGVNSFQLMKTADGWKIIYLVDTRRPTDCE